MSQSTFAPFGAHLTSNLELVEEREDAQVELAEQHVFESQLNESLRQHVDGDTEWS